jgi:hypothetical protein
MIGKRLKKIGQIAGLIAVRQLWFWGRNLYKMWGQPYLTIRELIDNRDKSQIGLMGVTAILPALFYMAARIAWDIWRYKTLLPGWGNMFIGAMIVEGLVAGYVGYWWWRVARDLKIIKS